MQTSSALLWPKEGNSSPSFSLGHVFVQALPLRLPLRKACTKCHFQDLLGALISWLPLDVFVTKLPEQVLPKPLCPWPGRTKGVDAG